MIVKFFSAAFSNGILVCNRLPILLSTHPWKHALRHANMLLFVQSVPRDFLQASASHSFFNAPTIFRRMQRFCKFFCWFFDIAVIIEPGVDTMQDQGGAHNTPLDRILHSWGEIIILLSINKSGMKCKVSSFHGAINVQQHHDASKYL